MHDDEKAGFLWKLRQGSHHPLQLRHHIAGTANVRLLLDWLVDGVTTFLVFVRFFTSFFRCTDVSTHPHTHTAPLPTTYSIFFLSLHVLSTFSHSNAQARLIVFPSPPVLAERIAPHRHGINSQRDLRWRIGFSRDHVQLQLCRHASHDPRTGGAIADTKSESKTVILCLV